MILNENFNKTHLGDCLELMEFIENESINLILCDLPYGVTKNKWDTIIPLNKLWNHYERIIKPNGAIILFGQDKFSAKLMLSNEKLHRYNLIWEKTSPTGHLNAKLMPLRSHEDILVFYKSLPTYNPQKTTGHIRKVASAKNRKNSINKTNKLESYTYGKQYENKVTSYDSTERYPKSILTFPSDKQKSALHPTQKPLALMEYLIKTYSNENDLILDNCAGSGTTGLAAKNLNRNFILIENNVDYYNICIERLKI